MKNQLKTILLLGLMSSLLVGIGAALGPTTMYTFLGFALLMNLVTYFFSDKIVLAMHRAREVGPQDEPKLHAIVAELAGRAGIPKPRIYTLPQAQPNAFATGRNPAHSAVAVTDGILQLLSERELRGVLAHELSHVHNRDILVATVAAAIAAAISSLAHFGMFFGGRRDNEEGSPFAAIALAIVAPIAGMLIQLGISRSREYLADETGARLSGDPEALASALEKLQRGVERMPSEGQPATASLFIVSPLAGQGGMTALFSTHPPLEERIRRLRLLRGVTA